MNRSVAVALGERTRVAALVPAGVAALSAETPHAVRAAWDALPPDVSLVILTPAAAAALGPAVLDPEGPLDREGPLTAVMPG
ncbi:hypothetical protein [Streptomyces sp. GC420]|uniref:hypothetical protein n=1 Tax=Streptomyces sp. GC420 TaxID=2697568 RepID=UPI001AA16936|nr:hypothetical protein [Streptomyces sp. GC420]